jgi:hypothetical protein
VSDKRPTDRGKEQMLGGRNDAFSIPNPLTRQRCFYLSGNRRKAALTITKAVITRPHSGGTEGVRATKYAAK